MDVGFYLSELLMQQGKVNVPGLGYFVQARMNSYYNESEGVLYPPYHQVQFSTQSIDDDDTLIKYIADKKSISPASAAYFLEKYVTGLKQQAATGEVAIGNVGGFYIEQSHLTFRPTDKITNDLVYYGYPPVKIKKLNHSFAEAEAVHAYDPEPIIVTDHIHETVPPVLEDILHKEPVLQPGFQQQEILQESFVEETEERKPSRIWVILIISIIVVAAALLGLYNFNPQAFNKLNPWQKSSVGITPVRPKIAGEPKIDTAKIDTAKINTRDTSLKTGSIAKPVKTVVADTLKKTRYEIIATSFTTTAAANTAINNFKSIGIAAHVVTDAPGRRLKITVGTFATRKEAEATRIKLMAAGKIRKDAYPIEINPK